MYLYSLEVAVCHCQATWLEWRSFWELSVLLPFVFLLFFSIFVCYPHTFHSSDLHRCTMWLVFSLNSVKRCYSSCCCSRATKGLYDYIFAIYVSVNRRSSWTCPVMSTARTTTSPDVVTVKDRLASLYPVVVNIAAATAAVIVYASMAPVA